jgi:hypothetical protein
VLPSDEEILGAIVALADDGFAARRDLILGFRKFGERDLRRALGRSARRGLILERKDAEGRGFVALSSEGWELLRTSGGAQATAASVIPDSMKAEMHRKMAESGSAED